MTNNWIILPVIMHLLIAVVLILLWRKILIHRILSVVGNIVILAVSVSLFSNIWTSGQILTMQVGNWRAPFGITLVADVFSSMMVLLASVSGLAVTLFSTAGISESRMRYGYFAILHFLLMGLNGAFLTGDIFNLYVWFEIIIISSFVLMTLGGKKPQIEGAINYVVMNILASVLFLTAIALLYGLTGSLNMADLSLKVALVENSGLVHVSALMFFVAFGIKSAVFPLYFWLPSSYHTPPSAIAAVFGGLLTKVGVYALLRVFTIIFVPSVFISDVLGVVAVMTLLTGSFGIVIQRDLRKLFSYMIVCHIGYMIAGLSMYTAVALTGVLFYLIHDIIIKTNIFLAGGVIHKIKGTLNMDSLGGMYSSYPGLSLIMAIVFFSLVGIPPLSGFWPKIYFFEAGFRTGSYVLILAIIVASFMTLYVVGRLWVEVFWQETPLKRIDKQDFFQMMTPSGKSLLIIPVLLLATVSLYIGFFAEQIVAVSRHIADELMNTSFYVEAVLGAGASNP
jgi:multicomponent Na+:H+ antiporter subunit D